MLDEIVWALERQIKPALKRSAPAKSSRGKSVNYEALAAHEFGAKLADVYERHMGRRPSLCHGPKGDFYDLVSRTKEYYDLGISALTAARNGSRKL